MDGIYYEKKTKDIENVLWGIAVGLGFGGLPVALAGYPPMLGLYVSLCGTPIAIFLTFFNKVVK